MGFKISNQKMNEVLQSWAKEYYIYAPTRFVGKGIYSDTDYIRYDKVTSVDQIEFEEKSTFSFKDTILKNAETLFYFTEDNVTVSSEEKKGSIIFLRSCDLHAVKRLDEIYLHNGFADLYYQRIRDKVKFVLMGCDHSFDNCFCVSMESNKCDTYDMGLNKVGEDFFVDVKLSDWASLFEGNEEVPVAPNYVTENATKVKVPASVGKEALQSPMWDEYNGRCIACGRCNTVCPTCTCYTMQDVFYSDNGKAGERRRVIASCMIDGYSDVAGGGSYRKTKAERMRFKVLHKVSDYKKRFGYHMCVGCGRCDDICPEYISFANAVNKLGNAEVTDHE